MKRIKKLREQNELLNSLISKKNSEFAEVDVYQKQLIENLRKRVTILEEANDESHQMGRELMRTEIRDAAMSLLELMGVVDGCS